jgi:hypothetical protein
MYTFGMGSIMDMSFTVVIDTYKEVCILDKFSLCTDSLTSN